MADDPRIRWELANPHGILIDEQKETWWSGRVFDLLEIDDGNAGLLLATETGGVWLVTPANDALALSNSWNNPDANCMAAGPDGSRHFFAGCDGGVIYETDASHSTPLLAWAAVSAALPAGAGDVYDVAVIRRHRLIIAACGGGLFWSEIPQTPPWWCALAQLPPKSGARPPYKWTKADADDVGQAGYYSVAVGSFTGRTERAGEEALKGISIVAGATSGGVLVGQWSGGKLSLKRPTLSIGPGTNLSDLFNLAGGPTSVAACEGFPRTLYAVCAKADGRLQMILRSSDGGQTWSLTKYDLKVGAEIKDVRIQAGEQGAWPGLPQGRGAPNNCIAVQPDAPGVFAIGWQDGTFVSPNGGETWLRVGGEVHHADVHALLFKPTTPDEKHLLYIGSDGGLAQVSVDDVFAMAPVARSDYNRNLATLQFYSTWVTRQFYGTTSISPNGNGWVSAGIHDNGNIYCNLSGVPTPWRQLNGGDGGWTGIVADGGLVSNIMGTAARFAQAYSLGFIDKGVIAVAEPPPVDPAGLISPLADVVRKPSYRNNSGQLMYAAGGNPGKPTEVHGLFQDGPEQTYHWERLGIVPDNLPVSAAGSYGGGTVMVAAGAGRIFALDSKRGTFLELPVILPKPAPATPQSGGGTTRIAMLRESVGFAMLNSTNLGNNYILRLEGLKWVVPLSSGLPTDAAFYGLDGFIGRDKVVIFAATDDRVYMSEDAGDNWVQASHDLPRRPHCADLRVGLIGRSSWLFLSTFGRSLWRANLDRLETN